MALQKCHVVMQIFFKLYSWVPASCFKPIKTKHYIYTHTFKNIHVNASYWKIKITINSLRIESQKNLIVWNLCFILSFSFGFKFVILLNSVAFMDLFISILIYLICFGLHFVQHIHSSLVFFVALNAKRSMKYFACILVFYWNWLFIFTFIYLLVRYVSVFLFVLNPTNSFFFDFVHLFA